tara:strand:- start:4548 stop:5231 length:684 start_codon:yes stop_codon:yes gene_type:complete
MSTDPIPAEPAPDVLPAPGRPLVRTRNVFLTGLAVMIPALATLFLLNAGLQIIDYVTGHTFKLLGLRRFIPQAEILGVKVVPLVILTVIIFAVGMVATHSLGSRVLQWIDGLVLRIPLISTIYSAAKQVVETLRTFEGTPNFQYVVYLDYPAPGARLLGFVTGHFQDTKTGKKMTTVFLPTSPNPITGFLLAVDSDKVVNSSLSVEEASKLIVSAGLVAPQIRPKSF